LDSYLIMMISLVRSCLSACNGLERLICESRQCTIVLNVGMEKLGSIWANRRLVLLRRWLRCIIKYFLNMLLQPDLGKPIGRRGRFWIINLAFVQRPATLHNRISMDRMARRVVLASIITTQLFDQLGAGI
jgi:hypothetical protein